MYRPDLPFVPHAIALANHLLGLGTAKNGNGSRFQKTLKKHALSSRGMQGFVFSSSVYVKGVWVSTALFPSILMISIRTSPE
jgi:hypothetical protein